MTHTDMKALIPLDPPIVALADPEDGLLKTVDLYSPIPVQVMVWPAAEPGYYFQLMLNGDPVGERKVIGESDNAYDLLTIDLNEKLLLDDGDYYLGYIASSPNADSHVPSPEITLRVDRSRPGAALLAPMIFPEASFGDVLTGLVPGYAGMEQGDVIQTLCNGAAGPTHTVQPEELTLRPIEIDFKREVIRGLAMENLSIEYQVTDRAGNPSIMSLPVLLSIKL
jgi:hypothetical protein